MASALRSITPARAGLDDVSAPAHAGESMTQRHRVSLLLLTSAFAACGGVTAVDARRSDGPDAQPRIDASREPESGADTSRSVDASLGAGPGADASIDASDGEGVSAGDDSGADASTSCSTGEAGVPACSFDASVLGLGDVPVFGSFSGPELCGDLCAGGAAARVERTVYGQYFLDIYSQQSYPPGAMQFISPANATGGDLDIFAEVSGPSPGTYGGCGYSAFCIYLPEPPGLDCGDAGCVTNEADCPAGCTLLGPTFCTSCVPDPIEDCYIPQECAFTLTSVAPVPDDSGVSGIYSVHGTFTSTMVGQSAGLGIATMSLTF